MKGFFVRRIVLILFALSIVSLPTVHTYASCGDFLDVDNDGSTTTTAVTNCSNPFEVGEHEINDNVLVTFNDERVVEGGQYDLIGKISEFKVQNGLLFASAGVNLYRHIGDDYLQVLSFGGRYTFTNAGVYTLVVIEEYDPQPSMNIFDQFKDFFVHTAHATHNGFPGPTKSITFTVREEEKEKSLSNIFFIPGIQASRLYMEDEDGDEIRLWEPGGNSDIERLRMNDIGVSENDVYTRDVIEEELGIGRNIYKGFLQFLDDLGEGSFDGPRVETFPYDWRYDAFDIVENGTQGEFGRENPVQKIKLLAGVQGTNKVTIIAHSNGGLLAKAIMLKLEEEGNEDLVDKIIFIGTPHIGTPKGFLALLHGYKQDVGSGLLGDEDIVRDVIRNMPGVYGLLPSEEYIQNLNTPIISFDDSSTTKIYRDHYGFTVSNISEYKAFLSGEEGREDSASFVNKIGKANTGMLSEALESHRSRLDTWTSPDGVDVYNIVGTGIETSSSVEYKEFPNYACEFSTCKSKTILEPVVRFTNYGDETVVSKPGKSAQGITYYLDGKKSRDFTHANMTESRTSINLIDHILHGSSTDDIENVTDSEPVFAENTNIHRIHSPATILIEDRRGKKTGKDKEGAVFEEIEGSTYLEIGEVKYVLVPDDVQYTVTILGEVTGLFTHMIGVLKGRTDAEEDVHRFMASSTPASIHAYTHEAGVYSPVSVDTNGDGVVEYHINVDGMIVEETITYETLKSSIQKLQIQRVWKRELLRFTEKAEWFSARSGKIKLGERVMLRILKTKIEWLGKKGQITKTEKDMITKVIDKLLKL